MEHVQPLAGVRLIPACAGKTDDVAVAYEAGPAHPRVCGENPQREYGAARVPGSSPRVRGKRVLLVTISSSDRLIPACAGKTMVR